MKVVSPTRLLSDAAAILEPIRDEVVVIGALAVQIALDGRDVALTGMRSRTKSGSVHRCAAGS